MLRSRILSLGFSVLLVALTAACSSQESEPDLVNPAPETPTQPTSEPATSAPQAVAEPNIPGWKKFEGRGISLWLPESYVGGDLEKDVDVVVGQLKSLGPDFAPMAQMVEQNPSIFLLWAFDSEVSESGFLSNINVTAEQIPTNVSVESYLDLVAGQLPSQFNVTEQESMQINSYEAGRIITEFTIQGVNGKQVGYVLKDGNDIYTVAYSTGLEEFDRRLPNFEKSIETFVIR